MIVREREAGEKVREAYLVNLPDGTTYNWLPVEYTGIEPFYSLVRSMSDESRESGSQYRVTTDSASPSAMQAVVTLLQTELKSTDTPELQTGGTTYFALRPDLLQPYLRQWEKLRHTYRCHELDPYCKGDCLIVKDLMMGSFGMTKDSEGRWQENHQKLIQIADNFDRALDDIQNRIYFVEDRQSSKIVGSFTLRYFSDLQECQLHSVAGRPYEYAGLLADVPNKLSILFSGAVRTADLHWEYMRRFTFSSTGARHLYKKLAVPEYARNGIVITPQ
jgi:hypothetical protein